MSRPEALDLGQNSDLFRDNSSTCDICLSVSQASNEHDGDLVSFSTDAVEGGCGGVVGGAVECSVVGVLGIEDEGVSRSNT
ncbi:unnamed protein product, partial [Protopolystoma xenopodis]